MEQVLRADRAAWLRIAEKVTSLKRLAGGGLPLDGALKDIESEPAVLYHLLPCPGKSDDRVGDDPKIKKKKKRKHDDDSPPKGGGKGKTANIPAEIKDLNQNMPDGARICWNYNIRSKGCKFAKAGQKCKRGSHSCMKCYKDHPQSSCGDDK